ncbi:DUF5694 domain-containing protein [Paucibacter sp. APW11]|uniref:DUF5694 domain-containing protein n=1 Tax=Roseateles aquae TaxID=3077235 RepID=A0ABU3PI61_9BURK|nr:DUF5694 domain-containing protein [Paucibacter sp. APW11]MDT9001807.1 DUF5694 domain-containing protein [Paucibacter sp. APW11]
MKHIKRAGQLGAMVVALGISLAAQAGALRMDEGMVGQRAQVLVLGTVHLNGLPKSFDPKALDGLMQRLAAFKPDIITIEHQSGEECDLMRRHRQRYGDGFNCADTRAAQTATGLDLPAALAAQHELLKAWPAQPKPAERRHLAAVFMAAADEASAYVQWLQLPEAERREGDGLDAALVQRLRKLETVRNESFLIAARLAAGAGLTRVHAVDNHTGDNIDVKPADEKAFWDAVQQAWNNGTDAAKALRQQEDGLARASDLLPLYRLMNSPAALRVDADANVGTAMRGQASHRSPQVWVGGWEVRNLRMVANIRETFRERPGARVLVIVGAAHKTWFDHWLGDMQGVDVVDPLSVLK